MRVSVSPSIDPVKWAGVTVGVGGGGPMLTSKVPSAENVPCAFTSGRGIEPVPQAAPIVADDEVISKHIWVLAQ